MQEFIEFFTMANWLAVLSAAVASMIIGFLWYGPLFGKPWMREIGFTEEDKASSQKGMGKYYLGGFITALITAFIFEHLAVVIGVSDLGGAIVFPLVVWIGFYATLIFGGVLWEKKSLKLFFINSLYWLVVLEAMSFIIVFWPF